MVDWGGYSFGELELPCSSPHRSCKVCGLHFVSDTDSENLIAALTHVARMHPSEFAEVAGFYPEEDVMDRIYYMVREGMFRTGPDGRLERVE